MKNNLVYLVIAILVSLLFSFCSSRSQERYDARLDDVLIYKSDIIQNEHSITFFVYDTAGYVVTITEYNSHIMNVFEYDSELVNVIIAYPAEAEPVQINLKIDDTN